MQKIIIAAASLLLRNPNHEAGLARYWKDQGLSAAATGDQIAFEPHPWHVIGNAVLTHECEALDIERMDALEDPFTYTMDGDKVFVEKHRAKDGGLFPQKSVPLLNSHVAFHADKRRTMNRFLSKAEAPRATRVPASQLSLMFWADVTLRIREFDDEDLT